MIRLIQRRLIIPRGDTGTFSIPVLAGKDTGDASILTIFDPLTHRKLREKRMELSDGVLTVNFTHGDTVNLPVGQYVWDIKFYSNPVFADDQIIDGEEVDSYYAAFTLPVCEIRETGDNLLMDDDAPQAKLAPGQIDLITAAITEIQEAREAAANSAVVANTSATNAENSADAASISAQAAQNSEVAAAASQTGAAASASHAASSAVAAEGAAAQAAEIAAQIHEEIPTKVSELDNDAGYLSQETDPTVPAWAKAQTKPTYTAQEVGAPTVQQMNTALDEKAEKFTINLTLGEEQTITCDTLIEDIKTAYEEGKIIEGILTRNDGSGINLVLKTIGMAFDLAPVIFMVEFIFDLSAQAKIRITGGINPGSLTEWQIEQDYVMEATDNTDYNAQSKKITYLAAPTSNTDAANKQYVDTAVSGKANSADLAAVATSGSYTDLSNKPFIPSAVSDLTDDSGHYTKPAGGIPASDLANGVLDVWSGLTYHTSTMSTDSDSFVLGGATDAPTEINKCLVTSTPGANVIPKFDYQGRLHSVTPEDEWDGSNAVATTEYVDNMISDNMPEIPTNVSELNNDAGYLTSYTETDPTVPSWAKAAQKPSYTAAEVGAPTVQEMNSAIGTAIGNVHQFDIQVVQALPTQDIQEHTVYFVPKTGDTNDVYDEYIYVNNGWEMIGNTQIDLSNYVQKTDYATTDTAGIVQFSSTSGFVIGLNGKVFLNPAGPSEIKEHNITYKSITPKMQNQSVFYGLAEAAGDTTQSQSNNAVGTYTADAKAAILNMFGLQLATDTEVQNIINGGVGA